MNRQILDTSGRVIFFPVRHHSPACARLVYDLALAIKPEAILIEGPSDYNVHMSELALDHSLPIAIYSYTTLPDGTKCGAFYPFCEYSPEWQALQAARKLSINATFIDLPFAEMAGHATASHRYADGGLKFNEYVERLYSKFGVENFDDFWDAIVEVDCDLDLPEFLRRTHAFAYHARLSRGASTETIAREEFMARQIRLAMSALKGKILVVTGAIHSYPLYLRTEEKTDDPHFEFFTTAQTVGDPVEAAVASPRPIELGDPEFVDEDDDDNLDGDLEEVDPADLIPKELMRGIALTPYSYERLDALTGYESGMPGPGFYDMVFRDRQSGTAGSYRKLLFNAVDELRKKKQFVSAADVIAVESTARALAALRGHTEVWRRDLIDAIIAAVVKEDLLHGCSHPLLDAINEVLRGSKVGKLALDAALPPLVQDIKATLLAYELTPEKSLRKVQLDLTDERGLNQSYVLHQLQCLGIRGFTFLESSAFAGGDQKGELYESWQIEWTPYFDADCIETAVYGSTIGDAASVKLIEKSSAQQTSESAALLLVEACLMGFENVSMLLYKRVRELINHDNDFFTVTAALNHLFFLFRYDEVLKDKPVETIGTLVYQAFHRSLWLLETLGCVESRDSQFLNQISLVLQTFERCEAALELERDTFVSTLERTRKDSGNSALIRGALTGALWSIGEAPVEDVLADMGMFGSPAQLGDFLTGLFALAREASQQRQEVALHVDALLMSFTVDEFLEALPSLRLAFSYFTPREKHYMAVNLLKATGNASAPLPKLEVSLEEAAGVMAYEERLKQILRTYGLRGKETTNDE